MARDPFFVVGFGASGDCWGVAVGGHACVDFLGSCSCTTTTGLLLLRKVGKDPDGVEEVGDAGGAG